MYASRTSAGAHINPAVTIGIAAAGIGDFGWADVPRVSSRTNDRRRLGAPHLVYVFYQPHYAVTDDVDAKLGTFCTGPAIRQSGSNVFSEVVGTFVLVLTVLVMSQGSPSFELAGQPAEVTVGLGSVGAFPVAMIVFAIGLSLGGTTGYAINPARDLGPRIAHAMLPIPGKRDSDWSYSWIPVVGPILGAGLAAFLYHLM